MAELKVRENNRFYNGEIYEYADSTVELVAPAYPTIVNPKFLAHQVVDGEDLTTIAFKYYGKIVDDASKYWFVIAEANTIDFPLDLTDFIGKSIIIPDIQQFRLNRE
jgi:hypothetical protein